MLNINTHNTHNILKNIDTDLGVQKANNKLELSSQLNIINRFMNTCSDPDQVRCPK